jgi:hypothetical protein
MSTPAATLPHTASPCEAPQEQSRDDASLWTRPMLEAQLARLDRLADMGLDLAAALVAQAKGETEIDVARGDIALAYGRAARAVRFTIALQSKLITDFQAAGRGETPRNDDDATNITLSWDDHGQSRKSGAGRIIGRVIAAETDSLQERERLTREVNERLGDDTLTGDLNRPYSEIVADICRDLGLEPDWAVLSQEAWAREEVQSGRPGAPLTETGLQKEQRPRSSAAARGPP